jgi:hypothetical protein
MNVRFALRGWVTLVMTLMPGLSWGVEREKRGEAIELFAALEAQQIEVKVIAEDATRLTIQVANKQDVPLTIRLPDVVAAVPVLAQMQPVGRNPLGPGFPAGPGLNSNRTGGNQAAQGLGAPFGQVGQNNGMLPGNPFPGGMMSVLPGKVVRHKLRCVCLDFGKPTPNAHVPYRLERLESVQPRPEVRELLHVLAHGGSSQRIVQLGVWHLANDVTWEELARVTHELANGTKRPQYSGAELELAQRLVQHLPSVSQPSPERLSRDEGRGVSPGEVRSWRPSGTD